jgi:DNA-binding transcriptional MocR family regulator
MLTGLRSATNRWVRTMSSRSQTQIDLLKGWPNPGLLPPNCLKEASETAFSDPRIWTPGLAYGPDDGYLPLRQELAKWLTNFYEPKEAIETGRICVTGGASQNLACLLQTFTDAIYTRNVWMVAPTYYLACRIFDDAGFAGKIRGVPEDEQGVDVEFLSQELRKSEAQAREEHNNEPVRSSDES